MRIIACVQKMQKPSLFFSSTLQPLTHDDHKGAQFSSVCRCTRSPHFPLRKNGRQVVQSSKLEARTLDVERKAISCTSWLHCSMYAGPLTRASTFFPTPFFSTLFLPQLIFPRSNRFLVFHTSGFLRLLRTLATLSLSFDPAMTEWTRQSNVVRSVTLSRR